MRNGILAAALMSLASVATHPAMAIDGFSSNYRPVYMPRGRRTVSAAASKRAATKRRNIRARSKK